ncbi:MAG: cytidylate kinase family protein, partial [Candidatus Binataceae bacterium]
MAVIAINQQLGSGGIELGKLAAAQLGYRFITTAEIAAETARRFNVSAEHLKVIDERLPHFWERMRTDMRRLDAFFRAVALEEMAADRTVAVGRFIALHLPEGSAGLRVRTVGAFAERVTRTAAEE